MINIDVATAVGSLIIILWCTEESSTKLLNAAKNLAEAFRRMKGKE